MQDGGVLPTTGFPRDGGTAKEGHRKDDSIMVQNSASHTTHAFVHGRSFWGYTFEACIFGAVWVRCGVDGSRCSRVIVEVVVHGLGRGTSRSGSSCSCGDGSCTYFRRCSGRR